LWSDLAANTIYSRTGRANNNIKVNRFIGEKNDFQKIKFDLFSLFQMEIVM
jgi:hypothetical protein